jgi:hypothetical protein
MILVKFNFRQMTSTANDFLLNIYNFNSLLVFNGVNIHSQWSHTISGNIINLYDSHLGCHVTLPVHSPGGSTGQKEPVGSTLDCIERAKTRKWMVERPVLKRIPAVFNENCTLAVYRVRRNDFIRQSCRLQRCSGSSSLVSVLPLGRVAVLLDFIDRTPIETTVSLHFHAWKR